MSCRVDWIPLGDLVHFESGGTPSKKFQTYWNGNIPWISAKTLIGDSVATSNLCITSEDNARILAHFRIPALT